MNQALNLIKLDFYKILNNDDESISQIIFNII